MSIIGSAGRAPTVLVDDRGMPMHLCFHAAGEGGANDAGSGTLVPVLARIALRVEVLGCGTVVLC